MGLDALLQQVKNAVFNDSQTQYQQGDTHGLIGQLEGLFASHQQNQAQSQPSGMDPYGGVPNEAGRFPNVRPASEDQYGDPADQQAGRFNNVRPASEDPYGDPADQR